MRSPALIAATLASTLACSLPAFAGWTVASYDVPGNDLTQLWGVNDGGVAVGQDTDGGFILDHGVVTTVVAPGALTSSTALTGIANSGLAVGVYYTGSNFASFLYQGGLFTQFAVPGGTDTTLRSISANGRYVAGTDFDASSTLQGFVYDRDTATLTQIPIPTGQIVNVVQGVNDSGQVSGSFRAESFIFDLQSATEQTIAESGNLTKIRLRAIDDAGLVGGWATNAAGVLVGIVGTPAAGFDTFDFGAGSSASVYGLNNSGEAVGWYVDAAGKEHGFIATSAVAEPAPALLLAAGVAMACTLRRRRPG